MEQHNTNILNEKDEIHISLYQSSVTTECDHFSQQNENNDDDNENYEE